MKGFAFPLAAAAVVASAVGLEKIAERSEPPGRVHVAYWEKWTGFERDAMQAVVDDFNRSQSRIRVDMLSISDISNKTMFAVSAGCPPDLAGLGGDDIPRFADDRAVEPLDDLCRAHGIRGQRYIPAYWDYMRYDGHVWALPSTPDSCALNYNWGMLQANGLDPAKPPKTLDALVKMADKLTIEKNGRIVRAGFFPAEPGYWNWAWGYFFGGKLWDGKNRITTDSPENVRAFTWVQDFSKRYGPSQLQTFKSGFGNFASPQNSFIDGEVAMEFQGVWMHNFVHRFAPELKLGVAPFPHPADRPDLENTTFIGCDILCIPHGAAHPKEAFEFINFVQTQPEMEKLCLLQEKNSPLNEVSSRFWQTHKNPDIRLYQEIPRSKNAVLTPQIAIWQEFNSEMDNAFAEVALMQESPKQAMQEVQSRMQPMLDQYIERRERRRREGL